MLRPLPGSERARVIWLLDAFQAAERAGVEAVGRWIVACADARLRGGLRMIRARDRRHAALAEARLRSLGGVPGARPSRELAALCGVVADPGVSDRSQLALLAERLGEMGVAPSAALAEPVRAAALERFGSERVSDEQKLATLLARYPDDTSATRPITDVLDRLHHDPETREILRLVAEGEAATVAWLRAYHAGLVRPASRV